MATDKMKAAREAIDAIGDENYAKVWLQQVRDDRLRALALAGIEAATAEPAEPFEPPAPYVAPPRNDEPTEVGVKWLRWFFDRVFDHGTLALMSEDWRRAADIVAALAEPAAESGPSDAEIAEWEARARLERLSDHTDVFGHEGFFVLGEEEVDNAVALMRRSRAAPVQQSDALQRLLEWAQSHKPEEFEPDPGNYDDMRREGQNQGEEWAYKAFASRIAKEIEQQSAAAPQPVVDSEYRSLDHAMEILRSCGAPYSGEQAHKVAVALKQSHDKRLSDLRNIRSLLPSYPDSGFGGGSDMELRAQEAWERSFGKIARRIESMLGGEQQEVATQPVVEALREEIRELALSLGTITHAHGTKEQIDAKVEALGGLVEAVFAYRGFVENELDNGVGEIESRAAMFQEARAAKEVLRG